MRYRKKPVVIEAFRWTGGPDQEEDPAWLSDLIHSGDVYFAHYSTPSVSMLIDTLEGTMQANPGDYIIRGVNGEVYPCKPDIFAATYEAVDQPPCQPTS